YASARFLVLDSNAYSFALTDQTAWLERELIAARQDPDVRHVFVVMHHPPFSISLHGGAKDLRERWTPLFEKYDVTAVFSGHDHVYTRAEHEDVHYFVSGGGGAPLYPKRPRPGSLDVEAVKRFERAFHYLRVTVSGRRVEVTAIRADGTQIETTTWEDGPEPRRRAPEPAAPAVASSGGSAAVAPASVAAAHARPRSAAGGDGTGSLLWIGIGGVGLLLTAALVVVRTLRR
ncbi:MAG: metallophosphoesterase family protein, partial [Kofleriaceae bacterium]